jgi:hypothetical protein
LAIPLLVLGAWFTLKHRIREIAPIMIFTSLLTLTYSIVQGNVGTAYRQRAQLLVFYFIFVGVGFVLLRKDGQLNGIRRNSNEKQPTDGVSVPKRVKTRYRQSDKIHPASTIVAVAPSVRSNTTSCNKKLTLR